MAKWVDQGENETVSILFAATSPWTNTYLGIYSDAAEPPETATLPGGASPITNSRYYRIKALKTGTTLAGYDGVETK
jgi:hypothetical protein